jgi:hypothetical protein
MHHEYLYCEHGKHINWSFLNIETLKQQRSTKGDQDQCKDQLAMNQLGL